jgi:hypothetical protein
MNKHHTVKELCNELNIPQTKYGSFKGWLYKNRELLDPRVNGSRLLYNIDSVRAFYPAYSPRRNPKATTNVSRHQLAKVLWYARRERKRARYNYSQVLVSEAVLADVVKNAVKKCELYYKCCNRAYGGAIICLTMVVIVSIATSIITNYI